MRSTLAFIVRLFGKIGVPDFLLSSRTVHSLHLCSTPPLCPCLPAAARIIPQLLPKSAPDQTTTTILQGNASRKPRRPVNWGSSRRLRLMLYWRCVRKVHSSFTNLNCPLDLLICGTAGSPALESDNERLARVADE